MRRRMHELLNAIGYAVFSGLGFVVFILVLMVWIGLSVFTDDDRRDGE